LDKSTGDAACRGEAEEAGGSATAVLIQQVPECAEPPRDGQTFLCAHALQVWAVG
jgi:hypothetical protein